MNCDLCNKELTDKSIRIIDAHICRECESRLVQIDVHDSDYVVWIERIKKIWQHLLGSKEFV